MSEPLLLSTSSFNEASSCLKKFEYHQVDHLVPIPSSQPRALRRGTFIHRGLEALHQGKSVSQALKPMVEWAVTHGVSEEEVQGVLDETARILAGYVKFWEGERWETIAAEKPIIVGTSNQLRATVDLVVKTRLGKFIVEHKSTKEIPPASWRAIDPQTALQLAACRASGDPELKDVDGILFNYLSTVEPSVPRFKLDFDMYANTSVTTSQAWEKGVNSPIERKGKDPLESPMQRAATNREYGEKLEQWRNQFVVDGKFYQRYPSIRPDAAVQGTLRDFRAVIEELKRAQETGYYRRQFSMMSCRKWCFYSEICSSEYLLGKENPTMREELYVIETPDVRAAGRIAEEE